MPAGGVVEFLGVGGRCTCSCSCQPDARTDHPVAEGTRMHAYGAAWQLGVCLLQKLQTLLAVSARRGCRQSPRIVVYHAPTGSYNSKESRTPSRPVKALVTLPMVLTLNFDKGGRTTQKETHARERERIHRRSDTPAGGVTSSTAAKVLEQN